MPATKTTYYRAYCNDCQKSWIWRETEDDAEKDAEGHQKGNPLHEVIIQTKVTSLSMKVFRAK